MGIAEPVRDRRDGRPHNAAARIVLDLIRRLEDKIARIDRMLLPARRP